MTKRIDVEAIAKDSAQRFAFLREFVGFGDDDWAAIRESVAVLAPKLPALLDAIYDHLLSFDDTRRIFLGARGEVDPAYIAIRKEHLTDWVLKTVEGNEAGFGRWLSEIGRRHTGVAGEPNRVVPPRYMVALTSFVQTALTATILEALADQPAAARRTAIAWNKMMMIQLEIFLKAIAPAFPNWDEG
jgi:hypothetical protein